MDNKQLVVDEILKVSASYRKKYQFSDLKTDIQALYSHYIKKKQSEIAEFVASIIAIDSIVEMPSEEFLNMITPQMHDAFVLQYPNVPIETLADMDYASRLDYMNGWAGKLNEIMTRDMLNSGYEVGGFSLTRGQTAILADNPTQAGWDMAIVNNDGSIAQEIQLKATDSVSYIHETLERYPDIPIITTSEIGGNINDIRVTSSEISNDELRDNIATAMQGSADSLMDSLMPVLPFMLILMTEAMEVGTGKKSKEQAFKDGTFRIKATSASMLAGGSFAYLIGGIDPSSIMVSLMVRMGLEKYRTYEMMEINLQNKIENLDKLLLPYRNYSYETIRR